jgi:glutathione peroxidase
VSNRRKMKHLLADLAAHAARPASWFIRALRGTTRVHPLSRSFYTLTAASLNGQPVDFSRFTGRVSLVVNVASECGFTPQYSALQSLHEQYGSRGFEVLAFPSNEFGGQEPGSPEQIQQFCRQQYGVTFPVFEKVRTKPGADQSPVYRLLAESGHLPAWNFHKFLIGRDGQVLAVFPTSVTPASRAVRRSIERALAPRA